MFPQKVINRSKLLKIKLLNNKMQHIQQQKMWCRNYKTEKVKHKLLRKGKVEIKKIYKI